MYTEVLTLLVVLVDSPSFCFPVANPVVAATGLFERVYTVYNGVSKLPQAFSKYVCQLELYRTDSHTLFTDSKLFPDLLNLWNRRERS